jgi:2,2-dialkylglycine decarboxylase (pyruvate)
VVPDILVLSKGVGGGFPLSAVVTTGAIASRVAGRANQFSSHQSDPLGAAAGLAVIDIIESEGLVRRAAETGEYLQAQLRSVAERRPHLINIRGRGLMVGFDVVRDPEKPTAESDIGRGVEDDCRERGVHLQAIQKNRFRVLPPLVITREEIDRFVTVLDEALERVALGQAQPRKAENAYTAAFQERQLRGAGVGAAMEWAWTHSPAAWVSKLRDRSRRVVRRAR